MADSSEAIRSSQRWAQLRLSIVGGLLASPPAPGELGAELERLARRHWLHPISGQPVCFALSTIERWYYAARSGADPLGKLHRKLRSDSGTQHALGVELAQTLRQQYAEHRSWSYKLHLDNVRVLVEQRAELGRLPSYPTLRRFMLSQGLLKQRRVRVSELRDGERRALEHRESREVRSYEAEYVSALWHLDFHHGSLKVLTPQGEWMRPLMLAILDDRSRLACHAQWYLSEDAANLVHGLIQALLKRGLPRALLSDNGAAMLASETTQGLTRLSILQHTTLAYSPYQNGKQEVFWAQVEGRLLAMLEGQPDLTLSLLNQATQAWVEMEYHHAIHRETGQTPLQRFLDGPSVGRACPSSEQLQFAFTAETSRTQRRSDGTLSIKGIRFEVPSRFRHLHKLTLRYAAWDLSHVFLTDPRSGVALTRLYPLDKTQNADGVRRALQTTAPAAAAPPNQPGIAPLLRKLMADYAATGLPPAYIPKEET